MKHFSKAFWSLLTAMVITFPAVAEDETAGDPTIAVSQVREIIDAAQAIKTPNGVDELVEVEIGGIPQWLSIRGRDRRNPILLFIHGGPAVTEMPVSWFYQGPLEDYFTVVQWDQRGSGKTAASSDQAAVVPSVTVERMIEDGEEVVSYLRDTFEKEKIFVLGHSWGSLIGLELAARHPDWLHAYIGMGQVIHTLGNETAGYDFALNQARLAGNETAVEELEAIAPYPQADGSLSVPQVITQRKWLSEYGGMTWARSDLQYENDLRQFSPEYDAADLTADEESYLVSLQLLPQLSDVDYRGLSQLDVPVFLFLGRYDHAVSSEIAFDWFSQLEAPYKQAVWFEHSAHMMHFEQPGRFIVSLVQHVRPVAVEARDVAPEDAPGTGP